MIGPLASPAISEKRARKEWEDNFSAFNGAIFKSIRFKSWNCFGNVAQRGKSTNVSENDSQELMHPCLLVVVLVPAPPKVENWRLLGKIDTKSASKQTEKEKEMLGTRKGKKLNVVAAGTKTIQIGHLKERFANLFTFGMHEIITDLQSEAKYRENLVGKLAFASFLYIGETFNLWVKKNQNKQVLV